MKRVALAIGLAVVLIVGFTAADSMANGMMAGSVGTADVDRLLSVSVNDNRGAFLGIITDFVKEADGRVVFAILNIGKDEDYGESGRLVAVPFGTVSCGIQACTLNSSYEQLAASPVFLSKDELIERRLAGDIYRHYGMQPHWTE